MEVRGLLIRTYLLFTAWHQEIT
ncbi:hypothetical protein LINGRAHAP2_LOCUS7958 [Linum grandiflorum]